MQVVKQSISGNVQLLVRLLHQTISLGVTAGRETAHGVDQMEEGLPELASELGPSVLGEFIGGLS